jgi:hypothetical protein
MCRYHDHGLTSSSSSSSSQREEDEEQKRDWNMYDTVRIVRGPLLVLGAMMVLIYPFLSPWIVMIWTMGCVGIMVTAMDVVYHWMPIWILKYAKSNTKIIQQVVLDDVLKSIFSIANGGMIASIVGSIIGCFSMYNLPLTPEQRTRIIQSCLPPNTTTNTNTSHELLFQPGGLWNFLQSLYYQKQTNPTTTNSDSLYDDKRSNVPTTTAAVVVQETIPNDLTWNDNDDDNACDDKDDDETDHSTLEEITAASSTPPPPRLLLETTKHATTTSSSTSNANNRNDPVEVFWSILTCEVGPQIGKQIMDKLIILDPTKVGMISALTLMVQLKYSPFLRKLIHNVAHGSLAATLLTVTVASFTTRQLLLTTTTQQQQQQQQQVSSSTSLLSHRHQLRRLLPRTIKGILAMAAMILVGRTTQTKHKRRQRRRQRVSR